MSAPRGEAPIRLLATSVLPVVIHFENIPSGTGKRTTHRRVNLPRTENVLW